jgi:hypothetical protein
MKKSIPDIASGDFHEEIPTFTKHFKDDHIAFGTA